MDVPRRPPQAALLGPHGGPPAGVPDVIVTQQVKHTVNEQVRHDTIRASSAAPGSSQRGLEADDNVPEQGVGRIRQAPFPHGERKDVGCAIASEPLAVERADGRIIDPQNAQLRVRTSRVS